MNWFDISIGMPTKKTDLLRPVFLFIPSLFSLFQYAVDDAVIEVHVDFDSHNGDLAIAVGGAVQGEGVVF